MYAIETCGLTKYYGKSRGILDITLQVQEGEIFGFIGPNGAGKSTTIRTLLNFIFPTKGWGKVLGLDIVSGSLEIRRQVGYLPSETVYYDEMTALELLSYSASFYPGNFKKKINKLLETFELETDKRIRDLSMGNKKKVGIIQALLHKPRLLILDEPTGGLDPLMQRRLFEVLQEVNKKGTTIFFSSHILSDVQRLCNRVGIIKEGRIIKIEEMDTLRANQFRNVRISFKDGNIPVLDLPGVISSRCENGLLHLFFNGDINFLIKTLGNFDIANLWLEEPTLEEVFMHYYEKE
jgi:ABC-2 type transport system ATP-binding protein